MGRIYSSVTLLAVYILLTAIIDMYSAAEFTYSRQHYGVLMCTELSNRFENNEAKVTYDGLTCNIAVPVNSSVKLCLQTRNKSVRCVNIKKRLPDPDTSSTEAHPDLDPPTAGSSQTPVERPTAAVKRRINICDENSPISESCNASWVEVLEAGAEGQVLNGSGNVLLSCISQGLRLKVFIHGFQTALEIFFTTTNSKKDLPNNDDTINEHICGQTGIHLIPKRGQHAKPKAVTLQLCTTGRVIRHFIAFRKNRTPMVTKREERMRMTWFAFMPKGKSISPVYAYDRNGEIMKESDCTFQNLKGNLLKGSGITVVSEEGTSNSPCQSVLVLKRFITATDMRALRAFPNGSPVTLVQLLRVFETNGLLKLGFHQMWSEETTLKKKRFGTNLVLDRCWKQVYDIAKPKSSDSLKNYIKRGHRIKIVMPSDMTRVEEPQVVFFARTTFVHGQLLYNVADTEGAMYHNWQFVRMNYVMTSFYAFEQNRFAGTQTFKSQSNVKWFVDTTPWYLVFHRAVNGNIIFGSLAQLRLSVKRGAQVRVGCKFQNHLSQYSPAEQVVIKQDGNVHATLNAHLKLVEVKGLFPKIKIDLKRHPMWTHMTVSSDGTVHTVYISHTQRKYTSLRPYLAETKWFIQP